jgi:hypothetical protein
MPCDHNLLFFFFPPLFDIIICCMQNFNFYCKISLRALV